ncbi:MAG: S8 family peptidase [Thermoguttaceae bacterium]
MSSVNDFMHLPFPAKQTGKAKLNPNPNNGGETTQNNRQNRQAHGNSLRSQARGLSRFWEDRRATRQSQNLPTIAGGVPFLLEIEPTTDVDFLRGLGFEIVCDLEEGFIVVSSEQTDLADFQQKVEGFVFTQRGTGNVAKVYALCADADRLKRILSERLYSQWNTLDDNKIYTVELSVSCAGTATPPNLPTQKNKESDDEYNRRVEEKKAKYRQEIDDIIMERQGQLENIVRDYDGELPTAFIEDGDTFSVTMTISGRGLRDIVLNYPYIFEVAIKEDIVIEKATENTQTVSEHLTIIAPVSDSPVVCVIDSGIQENHKYLQPAILEDDSMCLIPGQTSVADDVSGGGHGTRVAGAILYPNDIPISGEYRLPCFIRNVKVLDGNNGIWSNVSREGIIETVVQQFAVDAETKTKIFNHSVGEGKPFYELKHMSSWAAKIDEVSYESDVLFVQAAGNMIDDVIKALIQARHSYPDYLGQPLSQIANPAQSLQALTVGSISHSDFETDDTMAMGKRGEPSSFSRVGPGIWDSIKPDVVEYGGTHAINKTGTDADLTMPEEVCPNLLRRSPQGPAFSRDNIGTSFAAPKVASIATEIQKTLPNSPALLYRALIAQSARWPGRTSPSSNEQYQTLLRRIGYGVPNVDRATHNNEYRATLATMELLEIGEGEAHIFTVNVPKELRDLGEDNNILVEITLSYAAKPKRTRRSHRSYLSTWLDWICSKKSESRDDFSKRIFETGKKVQDDGQFSWVIHERANSGQAKYFSRSRQTLQKDWCVVSTSQLSDSFCIAVRGHKGWGSLFKAKYVLAVSFEAVDQNIQIYEPIRLSNQIEVEADVENPEIRVEITEARDGNETLNG